MKKKDIAIVGAGFSGLAIANYLLRPEFLGSLTNIVIIDPKEIGANASGISAGLLHPYPGAHAKLTPKGKEGVNTTIELLKTASESLQEPVFEHTGVFRVALNGKQKESFARCASLYDDVSWWDIDKCQKMIPGITKAPGIFLHSGMVIKTQKYIRGLWKTVKKTGTTWKKRSVTSLAELDEFDIIIVAAGAHIKSIFELRNLPIRQQKGQILELEWPASIPPLEIPVNSQAYLVQADIPHRFFVGATFERKFRTSNPDLKSAISYLEKHMTDIFPGLIKATVLNCYAALRATTPNYLPLAIKHDHRTWILTGMGSKGLLFHALYAKQVARAISDNIEILQIL